MSRMSISIFLLFFLLLQPLTALAQVVPDSTTLYRVETTDGNEYSGKIIYQDDLELRLSTEKLGILTLSKKDISKITQLRPEKMKNGVYWADNPQSTRYLWQPNGYGLKAGEAYYQNIWVLFNQLSVGLTNNISLGVGMLPLFLFGGSPTPVWLAPKISIPIKKDKFNMGAGALLATVIGESSSGFGILYGIATAGSRDNNISLGLGYGFADGGWAESPTLSLSGMVRTGARGYLISENYYIDTGSDYQILILSAGFRWIIKKAGLDFSLIFPFEESMESFVAFPWLGVTIPFGKVKNPEK
jgi:hypothetical protein